MDTLWIRFAFLMAFSTQTFAAPLPTRDQNPVIATFSLPTPYEATLNTGMRTQIFATYTLSNTSLTQTAGREALLVDAETNEWQLNGTYRFSDRLYGRAQLIYHTTSGGYLDSMIEGWHNGLSLPDGNRATRSRNQVDISYLRDGQVVFEQHTNSNNLSTAAVAAGYQWWETPRGATTTWLTVALPNSSADALIARQGVDTTISLASTLRWSSFASSYLQLAATHLGGSQQVAVHDWVWSSVLSTDVSLWNTIRFTAQLEGHSAVIKDSQLTLFGDAVTMTLGSHWTVADWKVMLGFTEDIKVEASPDVSFIFSLGRAF